MNKFIDNKRTSYLELAKMFYDLFSNPSTREEFYTEVVENASSVDNTDLPSALRFLMNTLRLCNNPPNQSCLLLFGIDEVHLLFEQRKEDVGSNYTIFSRLKSIISELVVESLCVVLLSTAGTVSELAPSPDVAPSIRERDDERILPTPFTQLPFDVDIVSDPLVPGKETLSSVGVLSFAAKFGRPMFVILLFIVYSCLSSLKVLCVVQVSPGPGCWGRRHCQRHDDHHPREALWYPLAAEQASCHGSIVFRRTLSTSSSRSISCILPCPKIRRRPGSLSSSHVVLCATR